MRVLLLSTGAVQGVEGPDKRVAVSGASIIIQIPMCSTNGTLSSLLQGSSQNLGLQPDYDSIAQYVHGSS